MKPIPYFEIIKQAIKIAWKNKFLWVFGLLVSLGSGPGISNANWKTDKFSPDLITSSHLGASFKYCLVRTDGNVTAIK